MDKDLVYSFGRPQKKYALTEGGWDVARRIKNTANDILDDTNLPSELESFEGVKRDDVYRCTPTTTHTANLEIENRADKAHARTSQPKPRRIPTEDLTTLSTEQLKAELDRRLAASNKSQASPPADDFVSILSSPRASSRIIKTVDKINMNRASENPVMGPAMQNKSASQPQLPSCQPLNIAAGTFTVELLLDNREVRSKTDRDYIASELTKRGVSPLMRSLELGDALWVAKIKDPTFLSRHGEEGDEVMLDWIVERKRLDDMIHSINDGRFQEQKWRLRRSGIKNVIYIIEDLNMLEETLQKYHEALESGIASTQVIDGYFVKKTQKLDDTIRYLARMTVMLKRLYEVGHQIAQTDRLPNADRTNSLLLSGLYRLPAFLQLTIYLSLAHFVRLTL